MYTKQEQGHHRKQLVDALLNGGYRQDREYYYQKRKLPSGNTVFSFSGVAFEISKQGHWFRKPGSLMQRYYVMDRSNLSDYYGMSWIHLNRLYILEAAGADFRMLARLIG